VGPRSVIQLTLGSAVSGTPGSGGLRAADRRTCIRSFRAADQPRPLSSDLHLPPLRRACAQAVAHLAYGRTTANLRLPVHNCTGPAGLRPNSSSASTVTLVNAGSYWP